MRKIFIFILLLITLSLVLTGCGGSSGDNNSDLVENEKIKAELEDKTLYLFSHEETPEQERDKWESNFSSEVKIEINEYQLTKKEYASWKSEYSDFKSVESSIDSLNINIINSTEAIAMFKYTEKVIENTEDSGDVEWTDVSLEELTFKKNDTDWEIVKIISTNLENY